MGYGRWDPGTYRSYTASNTDGKSEREVFTSRLAPDELNPLKFQGKRESRDSDSNPQSNAIIIACDVTGSMGIIADNLIRKGIGTTFEEILKRAADPNQKMISDPHLMVLGIGDVYCDQYPLQASQFEADIRIVEQLQKLYIEHGGGGNDTESYDAAWYFAAMRTSIDCFEKRNKKGYLFTIGDEEAPNGLTGAQIKKYIGGPDVPETEKLSPQQLLDVVSRTYNAFHIIIEEGSYARGSLSTVRSSWRNLMGQRVISLADHTKLGETIVSTILANEGMNIADVAKSWDGATARIVTEALVALG